MKLNFRSLKEHGSQWLRFLVETKEMQMTTVP